MTEQPESPKTSSPRRILLAEDCPAVRRSVKALLERNHFDVVGEAGDGGEAVEMAAKLRPDVVVLDRAMPRVDGFEAARLISRSIDHPPLILLTMEVAEHHIRRGMQVGIRGFVGKMEAADELGRAITEVASGRTFLSASALRLVLDSYLRADPGSPPRRDS